MKPRSQIVAAAAYQRISDRVQKVDNAKYATLVHKLPAMILQNGLAQTTGFLLAKNESHHQALLADLLNIFQATNYPLDPNKTLHQNILESDLYQIMRMTREALDIAGWLRRYVQGILKIDAAGESMEDKVTDREEQS